MKLTAKSWQSLSLPAGKSEMIFFYDDLPGFGLRVRAGGSKTWIFQYKIGDKQRRLTLGSAKAIDFTKARDGFKDPNDPNKRRPGAAYLHARVRLGEDPAGDKAESKKKAAETFEATAKLYLAYQKGELRPRSYPDLERHLLKHSKVLHGLQLGKIERRDIASCVASVTRNSGAVTGNRVRTSLSGFFAWSIAQGLVDQNPVIGTTRNEEISRERVLSPDELRRIWNALGDDDFGAIMKLLVLTGQRAGEVAGMRWSEIALETLEKYRWSLPGERTKNHRPHTVPLSEVALAIIAARPQRIGDDGKPRDLVFGAGEGPFSGWSNCKEALDERIAEGAGKALPHWTPHDLRRSFATHAAEIVGIQPHIIEAVLNHVSGHRAGVAGIYNRATYEPEKRKALDQWAEQLLAWAENRASKVTTLPQRRA